MKLTDMEDNKLYTGRCERGVLYFLYWDEEHLISFCPAKKLNFRVWRDDHISDYEDEGTQPFIDIVPWPDGENIILQT